MNVLLVGSVDVVDHQLKILHESPGDKLTQYYRFQSPLDENEGALDDPNELTLHALELTAETLIRTEQKLLEEACAALDF